MVGAMRLLCLAGCALVWTPWGHAAEGESRTYAVLSLIGDRISIVGHQLTTGSHRDTNLTDTIALNSRELDDAAVLAASNAIKRLDARAATVLLASSDPKLYELQDKLFEQGEQSKALLDSVKAMVQSQKATHLILITEYRDDAEIRLAYAKEGSGRIEGLGFYMDDTVRTRNSDTNAVGKGFIGPFAYIKISLVDATTMTIIRGQSAEETTAASTARATGTLRPWDALTGAQKVAALRNLINKAIARAIPVVLAAQ